MGAPPAPLKDVDFLYRLFDMQQCLNDTVFAKNHILPSDLWARFRDNLATSDQIKLWLLNFCRALSHEVVELEGSTNWKWWSKDPEPVDLQNARVEIVDMWHFLISLTLIVGMRPEDLMLVYQQKYDINLKRQEEGYSKETKTEADNESIDTGD